jgi:AsmA protein
MTKTLKVAGLIICIGLLVFIVGIGVVVTVISPNKFKAAIADAVYQHTGHHLVIDGDLSWSIFPTLGIKVGHMVLENAPGFKEAVFAEINQATVGVKLLPLLHATVQSTGIKLVGLKLNLIKNASGATNWQMLPQPGAAAAPVARNQREGAPATKTNFVVAIPFVDVTDAAIAWQDQLSKQSATITHFDLHAKDLSLEHPFGITVTCQYNANHPDLSGNLSLKGNITVDLNHSRYTIDNAKALIQASGKSNTAVDFSGTLVADMAQQTISLTDFNSQIKNVSGIKAPVAIQGALLVNLALQTAQLTDFNASIADVALKGQVSVANLNTVPALQGHLQVAPFDLKKWLQAIGQDTAVLQVANKVAANLDFAASSAKTASPIQALNLQGNITIDTLEAAKLKATHLTLQAHLQNGVLDLSPVTAALYQGALNGQMKVTLTSATPQIAAQLKLTGVQAEPLLNDLGSQGSKIKLQGAADINLQITTAGTNAAVVVRNLNGNANLSFKDGQLAGINIGNLIDSAYALLKHQAAPAKAEDTTHFGNLTATAVINNGVVTNNDLTMNGPRFDTKGKGTIDLVNQRIDYRLETNAKNIGQNHNDRDMLNFYNMTIPITVTGSLSDPRVALDAGAMLAQVAKIQIQNSVQQKVQDQVSDKLKDKIPANAGALLKNLLGH